MSLIANLHPVGSAKSILLGCEIPEEENTTVTEGGQGELDCETPEEQNGKVTGVW